jgi:hypothetical protein
MTARTNGAEFKAYYNDEKAWPSGYYHEDAIITINGAENDGFEDLDAVADGDILTIAGGGIYKDDGSPLDISMETHFTRWRKAQAVERVVVEVEKARKTEFLESIKRAGARVVK